nr:hypothetical protein [uncultured Desulfuromonas sp.]
MEDLESFEEVILQATEIFGYRRTGLVASKVHGLGQQDTVVASE